MIDRQRLRALLDEAEIDVILASSEKNFGYLTDFVQPYVSDYVDLSDIGEPDVHYAAFSRDSDVEPFMVQHSSNIAYDHGIPWMKDRRYYGFQNETKGKGWSVEDPLRIVAQALVERGQERSVIGVELDPQFAQTKDTIQVPTLERLKRLLPNAAFVEGSKVLRNSRMVKTPDEIEKIKRAVRATEKAITVAFESMRIGMTEVEMLTVLKETLASQNAQFAWTHMAFFPSKLKHTGGKWISNATSAKLHKGDVIHFDIGGSVDNYACDMSRNKVVDSPAPGASQEWADSFPTVWHANDTVKSAIKPGVEASELFRIGKKALTGRGRKMLIESVGHGDGLTIHEYPYLTEESRVVLQAGMVFSIETIITLPPSFYVHLEDMIHVTPRGWEPLTTINRDPFGR